MVKGSSAGMGVKQLMRDLGCDVDIEVNVDASAAKGIAMRRGLGKVRHIEVSQLWLQQKVANGERRIIKVDGLRNLADALTKHVDSSTIEMHMSGTAQMYMHGRHKDMPELSNT